MKKSGYTVDHVQNTITITKAFATRAADITTEEYKTFLQLRADLPGYKILRRTADIKKAKETHKGLSIEYMERCISTITHGDKDALDAFKAVKEYFKGQPAYYAKVKAWFLNKYSNYTEIDPAA